ncbi:type II toxin-antitoxin system HicB family antitoxin [Candidatus Woesearchaeota archaeon]|nr:type II toxin-antitoxin system HicB family antitoxin [Candidatus Woesearchaeota archaeon]
MEKRVHNFTVIIEKDEDGYYVGRIPALKGCHTQGKTMDELLKNIMEAIELCLEAEADIPEEHFVGIQQVQVTV